MKAKPVKNVPGEGYVECLIDEATHVTIRFPGPSGIKTLPFILSGSRDEARAWTWNGSVDKPTLRPSILVTGHDFRCHSWVNDGQAQFLPDCSHEHANSTLDLLEIE